MRPAPARTYLRSLVCLLVASGLACASTARREVADRDASLNEQRKRADALLAAREYEEAVRVLEPLTRELPRDDQLRMMLGDAHRGRGDYDGAVAAYEQAIRIDYGDYLPHLKLGTLLMENGKTGRALTEFEVAVKFGDADPLTHYNYGLALDELGRSPEALSQWRTAADRDPASPVYAEALARGLVGVDDAQSLAQFERARDLGADTPTFHNNYALALERAGRMTPAEQQFLAAVAKSDKEQFRYNLALHYLRAGRHTDAEREWLALIATHGERWSYGVHLARARLALERYDDAIAALAPFTREIADGAVKAGATRVDRVPPGLDEACSVLGLAWRGKGDRSRAVDYLARAVSNRPDDVSHLNNYGVVLAENGMLPDARAQWRRVLELDPDNALARANLSAYEP